MKIMLNDKYSYIRFAARFAGDTKAWFRYLKKHDKILKYNLSNLKVYAASPLYVLGMKLNPTVSGTRITDNDDVVDLIKHNPNWDIQEVYAQLIKYKFKISPIDLFNAFFLALDYDWYSEITQKFGANALQDFIQYGKFKFIFST